MAEMGIWTEVAFAKLARAAVASMKKPVSFMTSFQNHLLQTVSYLAMEARSGDACRFVNFSTW